MIKSLNFVKISTINETGLIGYLLTISDQCSHFITPENTGKPKAFWYFQGAMK